jgi:glycosyltransferase involved in cell wall biosynthesis
MRVLQIAAYAADFEGNFIKSLKEVEAQLNAVGDSVLYAFPENAKEKAWVIEFQKERSVYFLPLSKARISRKAYRLVDQIVAKEKVDVIHSHFELYDLHAAHAAKKYGAKVLWHLHDPIAPKEKYSRKLLRKFQYRKYGKHALMTSVCQYYGDQAVEEGMPKENVITILNGIDTSFIKDASHTEKQYDFLIMGWDFHRKGGDLTLDAFEQLNEAGVCVTLLFCGNQHTWSHLNERYGEKDPAWLIRQAPVEDINILYGASRAFLSASRQETFSYAVCEAAYAGLPVISTDIPGLEWTEHIPTVLHMQKDEIAQLKDHVIALKNCDFQCDLCAVAKTKATIETDYSAAAWAKKIIEAYR